ncbi:molecular chaperone DnaK [Microcoleus sp. FACHB-831]|uniref:molecular chaperone DnaK n=1 Tax=Microcoleus sp. FACHB-831 TaxID=2692827 RepID=UPI001683E10C|nr:molecular chaperone DnaK [Microcoleus sp. FACHB-831]MBD1923090.1 molecular chaperone DnaK [Microcoleus sp. FACHB-831]
MAQVIGIDLGATNACVAVMKDRTPAVIANAEGYSITPCVVAYGRNGDRLVGQIAKRQALMNPDNTFHSVKRFIGRKYDEVIDAAEQVSYQVLPDSNGGVKLNCPILDQEFTPEEITAQILRKLADTANKYLGEEVTQVVLTVPPYFNDSQRQATKDAGKLAGLEVLRIINQPTAACLVYELERRSNETILVFDLGGSTLDVTILDVGDGVFEVLATSSEPYLGGNDFDKKIVDWLAAEFQRIEGIDLRNDKQALQRLTEAAEKAKIELSSVTQAEINLPFITATQDGPKHIDTTLTVTQFEKMCSELIERCRIQIENAIRDARIDKSAIDEVVLVGGSTRIPAVKEFVRSLTGKEPYQSINPDEVGSVGAAIQASVLGDGWTSFCCVSWDYTYLSLGIETLDGAMTTMIPRHSIIPTKKSEIFSTATDGQTSIEIHVLQGERLFAKDNKSLGTLRLNGIFPAPKGVPQIEVTFEIDANGILTVSAKDIATEQERSLTINSLFVEQKELEQMLKDAEKYYQEDIKLSEPIEARKMAASLVVQTERQLTELGKKASEADKIWIEELLKNLRETIAKPDSANDSLAVLALGGKLLSNKTQPVLMQMGSPIYALTGAPKTGN